MENRRKAIICDIDGCLLDTDKVLKNSEEKGYKGELKWEYFHEHANNPEFVSKNQRLFELLNKFEKEGYIIILLTARSIEIADDTIKYLLSGNIKLTKFPYYLGRPLSDYRPSQEFKEDAIKELITTSNFDILFAIDDDLNNWKMFHRNGIPSFRYKINIDDDYDSRGFENEICSNQFTKIN